MGSSKKRRSGSAGPTAYGEPPRKKAHLSPEHTKTSRVKHAILSLYYPEILTLRQYVLLKLPESSRIRRRKICALGTQSSSSAGAEISDVERCVGQLLDTTLVGLVEEIKSVLDSRWEEWTSFPRRGDESYVTLSDGLVGATFSQSEIVDFVIWLLFSRTKTPGSFPRHLLSDGFRRGAPSRPQGQTGGLAHNVPGVYSLYPNPHVERLKEAPWPQFLKLLGSCGDRIMMDLLLDCSVFLRLSSGQDNYQQISGENQARVERSSRDINRFGHRSTFE
ncbi:uncharacterized protein BCR38DRAFT_166695 [Pseudomassariella vexata]|uniref:Telomerase reverse transcriptase n=1 Tax=Pseudomassariella vexata TaxID=1141098 RepID=A0A1Y2E2Q3_9PEZI|nr:uncharacterized protein BCR38DRAFT_166695 [Pseudomassariella vexata]ORY65812.1 hypothetical protein BCR38DRAFT_166695 [Pseudomassariella vexata]